MAWKEGRKQDLSLSSKVVGEDNYVTSCASKESDDCMIKMGSQSMLCWAVDRCEQVLADGLEVLRMSVFGFLEEDREADWSYWQRCFYRPWKFLFLHMF